jgi:hypothetical protein
MALVASLNIVVIRRPGKFIRFRVSDPHELYAVVTEKAGYMMLSGPPARTDNAYFCFSDT